MGLTKIGTMKITEILQGQDVTILIESVNYDIIMRNGQDPQGNDLRKDIFLEVQGLVIIQDFLLLTVESIDVILRMHCLPLEGQMHINWGQLIMKFLENVVIRILGGDSTLSKSEISFKMLEKL